MKILYKIFINSTGISIDTRKIEKGNIYFALKGENFNGNRFTKQALESGAICCVVDEEEAKLNNNCILVDDVLKTLQKLANFHRKKINAKVISLTGSNGKTTTKELIKSVLIQKFRTHCTEGNLNNHIGVPLSLLQIKESDEISIIEMGANHLKEIEFLCEIAEPDYGLITNFGKAHIEGFGSEQGVIKGKSELYKYLIKNKKTIFYNSEDIKQKNILEGYVKKKAYDKEYNLNRKQEFIGVINQDEEINSNLIGDYNYTNIIASITIGKYFGLNYKEIKKGIENYIPDNNRSQLLKRKGYQIIMDAYNSNPSSMEVAIENFKNIEGKKCIIIGEMLELGEISKKEHEILVKRCEDSDFESIIMFGKSFKHLMNGKRNIYIEKKELLDKIKSLNLDGYKVLIKGSRGNKLEEVLEII